VLSRPMGKIHIPCPMGPSRFCRQPVVGHFNGTFSITSIGGVASTFLLEWFRQLEQVYRQQHECKSGNVLEKTLFIEGCNCPALASGGPPRHLLSCHVDDDGVFKHLADPRALNRFGHHKAVFLVGSPIDAVASVFRRRFQCWHLYRLNNCWFTRAQREGLIPCEQPGIRVFRKAFGVQASKCRVPTDGPLSSLDAYARNGQDLFGTIAQFRAWMSCKAPACSFDILVIRYETLNASVPTLLDFLEVPAAARRYFPVVHGAHESLDASAEGGARRHRLRNIYGAMDDAINRIPPEGLWLRNRR